MDVSRGAHEPKPTSRVFLAVLAVLAVRDHVDVDECDCMS
jgi:hypothetical protein